MRYPTSALAGASVAALDWMTGSWIGSNGADRVEEHWSPVAGDTLVGMLRWVKGGRVFFYELLAIERQGDDVRLRIKHFDPGLVGWEDRDRSAGWLLVQLGERESVFLELGVPEIRWAIYRRESDDRLVSYFATEEDEVTSTGLFVYARS